ncbi:hypothetical protein [Streptomyces sp. P10-4]|uniref:hypothetical protein n=1 Tax=Streptomyces sp. P10-4 TaxID=3421645 RepID=UPI003D2BF465
MFLHPLVPTREFGPATLGDRPAGQGAAPAAGAGEDRRYVRRGAVGPAPTAAPPGRGPAAAALVRATREPACRRRAAAPGRPDPEAGITPVLATLDRPDG